MKKQKMKNVRMDTKKCGCENKENSAVKVEKG